MTIDMSGVTFIHPVALVGFLCLFEKLSELGKRISVNLPDPGSAVTQYLGNVRFLEALRVVEEIEAPDEVIAALMPRLTAIVPIQRFSTELEVEAITQRIEKEMSAMGGLMPPCHTIIAELASNVVQHSGLGRGWIMVQRYGYYTGGIIEIAVGDCGIGLRRSLRKNRRLASSVISDEEAVRLATKEGVSRFSDNMRGYGLDYVRREINAPERRFTLRSGKGCLIAYNNGKREITTRAAMVGVLAEARIPC